jgi:2'-5' RNA ligase
MSVDQPEVHRLFIAISLPEKVKAEVEKVQDTLRRALPIGAVRWTKPDQYHLTLKFLGNVRVSDTDALVQAAREACQNFPSLRLRAEWIGFFPTETKPRIVWVGVHDRGNDLKKLQKTVETAVKPFTKEAIEKNFTGHMTLGRCKDIERKNAELLRKVAGGYSKRFFGAWVAAEVEIYRSDLASGGSQYVRLASLPLAAALAEEESSTE